MFTLHGRSGHSDLPHLIYNPSSVLLNKALGLSARESVPSQTVDREERSANYIIAILCTYTQIIITIMCPMYVCM